MRRSGAGAGATVALIAGLGAAGAATARLAPSSLLVPPQHPYQDTSDPAVRTEGPAYPRHATGADEVRTQIDRPPVRVVSQDWSTDEYLYAILPPGRIVGVSESAYSVGLSNVYEQVSRDHPVVADDAERVLRAAPDLVFTPDSARADMPALLRAAGVPVYRMHTSFETLASIEAHIRLVGYLTGEDARAADEIARFDAAIARAVARRPPGVTPRVLGLGGSYSYGRGTLFDDVVRVLGAENVAATHGLVGYSRATDEHIVRWDPDWIIAGADRGTAVSARAALLAQPAIAATSAARLGHVVVFDNNVFLPLSPLTARFVEALAAALYGGGR